MRPLARALRFCWKASLARCHSAWSPAARLLAARGAGPGALRRPGRRDRDQGPGRPGGPLHAVRGGRGALRQVARRAARRRAHAVRGGRAAQRGAAGGVCGRVPGVRAGAGGRAGGADRRRARHRAQRRRRGARAAGDHGGAVAAAGHAGGRADQADDGAAGRGLRRAGRGARGRRARDAAGRAQVRGILPCTWRQGLWRRCRACGRCMCRHALRWHGLRRARMRPCTPSEQRPALGEASVT